LAAALGGLVLLQRVRLFHAPVEEDLQPHTDTEYGTSPGQAAADDALTAGLTEAGHTGTEGAHTGHHQTVGFQCPTGVGGDGDLGPGALHGPLSRTQVPGAVVEHGHSRGHRVPFVRRAREAADGSRARPSLPVGRALEVTEAGGTGEDGHDRTRAEKGRHDPAVLPHGIGAPGQEAGEQDQGDPPQVGVHYKAPLVEGIPVTRGSSSVATRRARARALNWHSTMWWALRP